MAPAPQMMIRSCVVTALVNLPRAAVGDCRRGDVGPRPGRRSLARGDAHPGGGRGGRPPEDARRARRLPDQQLRSGDRRTPREARADGRRDGPRGSPHVRPGGGDHALAGLHRAGLCGPRRARGARGAWGADGGGGARRRGHRGVAPRVRLLAPGPRRRRGPRRGPARGHQRRRHLPDARRPAARCGRPPGRGGLCLGRDPGGRGQAPRADAAAGGRAGRVGRDRGRRPAVHRRGTRPGPRRPVRAGPERRHGRAGAGRPRAGARRGGARPGGARSVARESCRLASNLPQGQRTAAARGTARSASSG